MLHHATLCNIQRPTLQQMDKIQSLMGNSYKPWESCFSRIPCNSMYFSPAQWPAKMFKAGTVYATKHCEKRCSSIMTCETCLFRAGQQYTVGFLYCLPAFEPRSEQFLVMLMKSVKIGGHIPNQGASKVSKLSKQTVPGAIYNKLCIACADIDCIMFVSA